MSTGENIKRIRKFRGMTQKELGIAIGIGEESASPRMAQYETDNRTPRKEMLHKMAVVLDVDPRNISIPTGYREEDMIYRLLVLEDYFPEMKLERNGKTGEVVINLQNKKINEFLYQWGDNQRKEKAGNDFRRSIYAVEILQKSCVILYIIYHICEFTDKG